MTPTLATPPGADGADWWRRAACARTDPALFDLDNRSPRRRQQALACCARCPVSLDCFLDAADSKADGVLRAGVSWHRGHPLPTTAVDPDLRQPAHGTRRRYRLGCRCLPCAKVEREYQARRQRKRARRATTG